MKHTIVTILLLLNISTSLKAQKTEPSLGRAVYIFQLAMEKTPGDSTKKFTTTKQELFFGKTASIYKNILNTPAISYAKSVDTSAIFQNEKNRKLVNKALTKLGAGIETKRTTEFFRKYSSGVTMRQEITAKGESYIISETNDNINWSISDEEKIILNFTCQKATGRYKGRNYIAWFTYSIPIQTGPWKLGGLPGLILEASDDRNEVVFNINSINIPYTEGNIPNALSGTEITAQNFREMNNRNTDKSRINNDAMLRASGQTVITKFGGRAVLIELSEN